MSLPTLLAINLGTVLIVVFLLWLVSLVLRDVSIVDIFWGSGFVITAWMSYSLSADTTAKSMWLVCLVTIWGLRLTGYLAWRNWGKPEDSRYRNMREYHGKWFPLISLFTVFLLQAVLMWVIALPVQLGVSRPSAWTPVAVCGALVWLVGLGFESIGDWQMARFKSDPENQGKVMNRGLWRYTRHPNYFGDFLVWWGLYFVAVSSETWWWTIIGPLLMSFLLLRVSGVTLLEKSLGNRLDGYQEYVLNTSAFFPWLPNK